MEVILIEDYSILEAQLIQIKEELLAKPYQFLISIHSRIELILVEINRTKVEHGDEIWKPDALFLKFLETVRAILNITIQSRDMLIFSIRRNLS